MAKIRGVKPEFWTDDAVLEISIPARLLFIGLWNYACDNGHLQDRSKQIKMRVLPTDDVNCAELLREMEAQGLIERADGWITIPTLAHHQKPHKRWFKTCDKEGCNKPEGSNWGDPKRESTVAPRLDHGVTTVDQPFDVDCEGDGEGEGDSGLPFVAPANNAKRTTSAADAARPKLKKRATQRPDGWRPNDAHLAIAHAEGVDPAREFAAFTDWAEATGKTYVDWDAGFRNWLRKAKTYGAGRSTGSRHQVDADMFDRQMARAAAADAAEAVSAPFAIEGGSL